MQRQRLFILVFQVAVTCCAAYVPTDNLDALIAKADIYYDQGAGQPLARTVRQIDALSVKQNIKLIVHGFTGSRTHVSTKPLIDAYRTKGYANVFVADWEDAAGLDYHTSRYAIGKVARHFGEIFNAFLNKFEIDRAEVHLIGHSLGAHIVGGMGAYFNGTLARITGLDPALPLFTPQSADGLHAATAQFVDVIHTDYPFFGDITPRGIADFYPHFGRAPQRGCGDISLAAASRLVFEAYSCSHNRAVSLYAATVEAPLMYPAMPCSWHSIQMRNLTACSAAAASTLVYMGENVTKAAVGCYYVS